MWNRLKWWVWRKWKKLISWTKDKYKNLLLSHGVALLLAMLTIFIGVAFKIASDDLLTAWPGCFWASDGERCGLFPTFKSLFSTPVKVWLFYVITIFFGIIFYLRERVRGQNDENKETELLNTILTIPPPDVLEAFEGSYTKIWSFIKTKVKVEHDDEEERLRAINDGIRLCLDGLTVLVQNFQRSTKYTRYAANIMSYRPVQEISDEERENILRLMEPYLEYRSFDYLKGILYLEKELSASTDDPINPFEIDGKLKSDLVFPVLDTSKAIHENEDILLPGAVTAFDGEKGNQHIEDSRLLLRTYDETEQYKGISRKIFENIERYFVDGKGETEGGLVRGFISILLKDHEGENECKLGVVNIHCDRPNLFASDWVVEKFLIIAKPILLQTADLLILRKKAISRGVRDKGV